MTGAQFGIVACVVVTIACMGAVGLLVRKRTRVDAADAVSGVEAMPAIVGIAALASTVAVLLLFPGLPGWAEALIGGAMALVGAEGGRHLSEALGADLVKLWERESR